MAGPGRKPKRRRPTPIGPALRAVDSRRRRR